MVMSSASNDGTLAQMDMVLAVTQQSINKQFELLYDLPSPNDPEKYFIDHVVRIGYEPHKSIFHPHRLQPGDTGITAWIGPPAIDITDIDKNSTPYRSIRFCVPLKGGWVDLKDGEDTGRVYFGDWIMTWMASIGAADIQQIEQDAIPHDTKEQIKKITESSGVPSEDFLVSSLFCLFETSQIATTFILRINPQTHADDKRPPAIIYATDPQNPLKDQYKWMSSSELEGIVMDDPKQGDETTVTLIQTCMNIESPPLLLGYAISQKIPKPSTEIPVFAPVRFVFSTTPATKGENHQTATLNFCMWKAGHENTSIDTSTGILTKPFSQVTREDTSSAAILGISRNTFVDEYLVKALKSKFAVYPKNFGIEDPITDKTETTTSDAEYEWALTYHYKDYNIQGHLFWSQEKYYGTNKLTMNWNSTLSKDTGSNPLADDSKRNLTIEIEGKVNVDCGFYSSDLITGPTDWVYRGKYWGSCNYGATLVLTTGGDGTWKFVPSPEAQRINIPRKSNGKVDYTLDHDIDVVEWVLDLGFDDSLFDDILDVSMDQAWLDNINTALKGLNSKVVLPAGDVLEFKGLDSDSPGNIYTHVTYKTFLNTGPN